MQGTNHDLTPAQHQDLRMLQYFEGRTDPALAFRLYEFSSRASDGRAAAATALQRVREHGLQRVGIEYDPGEQMWRVNPLRGALRLVFPQLDSLRTYTEAEARIRHDLILLEGDHELEIPPLLHVSLARALVSQSHALESLNCSDCSKCCSK